MFVQVLKKNNKSQLQVIIMKDKDRKGKKSLSYYVCVYRELVEYNKSIV